MKHILLATSLLATSIFAAGAPMPPQEGSQPREDSARHGMDSRRDSMQLPPLPDSLRAMVEQRTRDFDAKQAEFARDSSHRSEQKVAVDSLRKVWEAKRDTQVNHIQNDSTRLKVQARIEKVSEHRAAVKAKVDARKAKIQARKPTETPATP